jgi:hypothetical protein
MQGLYRLTSTEADWLFSISEGRIKKSPSGTGIPDAVLDVLLANDLIARDPNGLFEITVNGMAEVLRLREPDLAAATPPRAPAAGEA